jgi:hypothetical protein
LGDPSALDGWLSDIAAFGLRRSCRVRTPLDHGRELAPGAGTFERAKPAARSRHRHAIEI